ncbi:glycosyl transferase family 1 [Natronococcus pandeyae]|uniref:Glycosyl transferase family 1 n=1 Tax=Natronococcus pandeyae TaxID=2055836 RepID=A0A8J8TR36_9EURY|nr:glycosyltransferase [Natronococcus pandeyae]TYL39531.1 glycosyl transferase family 1 [Natronococcus pandeyae]
MHLVETADRNLSAYDPYIDDRRRQTIREAADELAGERIGHVNSTASGGGVAEILHALVPLSVDVGVDVDWYVMDAPNEFYTVTKTIHNALQGDRAPFLDEMRETYRRVTRENAADLEEEYDTIVLHDPQSLGMAPLLAERFPETTLVWRCHIDLTAAATPYLEFVRSFLDPIDHTIVSRSSYGERLSDVAQTVVHPAIDPLTEKNCPLEELPDNAPDSDDYPFETDRPLIVQVSRFDPWKDPLGVVEAYRDVAASIPDVQLVLAGGMPDDDPEGMEVYREVAAETENDADVHLLTDLPDAGINVLQRSADVVLQKSFREGFALTVSEALWKETPVVGSNVGGIPLQIDDGTNGYLVEPNDVGAAADRTVQLLTDDELRPQLGRGGRETVRERFLLPRLLEDYLTIVVEEADS